MGGDATLDSVELMTRFRSHLAGIHTIDLRCVPLDGSFVQKLPMELLVERVSASRLPTINRSRGGSTLLAGAALQRAKTIVEELLSAAGGPSLFKIGITCTPYTRFLHYEREGYTQMHLLHVFEEPGASSLINMS